MKIQAFHNLGQLVPNETEYKRPRITTTNLYEVAYYLIGQCSAHVTGIDEKTGQATYEIAGDDLVKLHHAYHKTNGTSITYEPVTQFIKNINELAAITTALQQRDSLPDELYIDIPKGYDIIWRLDAVESYNDLKRSLGLADPEPNPDITEDTDTEPGLLVASPSQEVPYVH